jgi:hypothetical protein
MGELSETSFYVSHHYSHLIRSAELFHVFIGSSNTTIIEFNIEWTPARAIANYGNVRDLFYSLARGIGNTDHYWFVSPKNHVRHPSTRGVDRNSFYHSNMMTVNIEEILFILYEENLLLRLQQ